MTSNRFPFTGSGRQKEGGELATRKQDFNAHVQGNGFRHTADNIDMNPVIPTLGGTTVQQTLEEFTDLVTSAGTGFISIGNAGVDGYAVGTYNMNTLATPTLKDAFNAAFADTRLQNGGIILVLSGTYVLTTPVTVPPGISIIGEIGGTLIIGEMAEQSMFIIESAVKELNINGDSGGGDIDLDVGSNVEKVLFSNLMLADNLNGAVASGDSSMLTVPMIGLRNAANFECKNVSFIGRVNDGPVASRGKTLEAIASISGGSTGTTLTVDECFFDGFKVPIIFIPGIGNKDHLNVLNCKIRSFGSDDGSGTILNSAIVSTLCHIRIINNHYIGAGTNTNTFLDIQPTSGSLTDIRVSVTGTTGSPTDTSLATLIKNESSETFNGLVTGNNWGNEIDSPWYIVVGGATGVGPLGDIFGPGAIDIILNMSTNNYQGTVIVNPGTYTVTGHAAASNFTNLKFIGNKIGKQYPIFSMNLTAVNTDSILNKFLVIGNHLESIQFTSVGTPHSIRPSFNATSNTVQTAAFNITVKDCSFINTSLNALDISVGPFVDTSGNVAKLKIFVENCSFFQNALVGETISLVLPPANIIHVKDCNFYGIGYAANIGNQTYSATNFSDENYIFENVTCDLTGFSINFNAPGGSTEDCYFLVFSTVAHVTMRNCQILCTNTLGLSFSRVSAGLVNTFFRFTYIRSKSIDINECVFNGPTQTFTSAAVSYVMPVMYLEPKQSCRVTNSRFINGGPLQIGGPNAFTDNSLADGCYIADNTFISTAATVNSTLLDFDLDINGNFLNGGHIGIHNNVFKSSATSATVQVRHTEQTDTVIAQGIVQVYAPFFDVRFTGNKVFGTLLPPTVNPYTNFAGFVANTYNGVGAADGGMPTSVHICDNRFDVSNSFGGGVATFGSSCCYVKAPVAVIQDNYLGMNNSLGSAIISFAGCLYLDLRNTATGAYSDSIVSGNIFSRRTSNGSSSNLAHGYIYIVSTSNARGMIVDNSFSDTTYDGTSTVLLNDNTTDANKWVFCRNKNQTVTVFAKATLGTFTNSDNSFATNEHLFVSYPTADLTVLIEDETANTVGGNTLQVTYNGTGYLVNFAWRLNLYDILPPFTHLVSLSISAFWDVNLPVSGTDEIVLTLIRDGSIIATDSHNLTSGAPSLQILGPLTTTQGINSRLDYSAAFYAKFSAHFASGTTSITMHVRPFAITYKW